MLKYEQNKWILKIYGFGESKHIKLIHMDALRVAGLEDETDKKRARGSASDCKQDESIMRARSRIFELAYCNPWSWFFTGTLDPRRYDRTNLKQWHKDLTQWLRNYNRIHGTSIKFLLIPELHRDGQSWHMHGFFHGLPAEHLKQFKVGDRMGKGLADKVKAGDTVFNWPAYQKKFGFCDVEPVRSPEAVSKYVTKYVSKNLASSVKELNAHMYYHSRGLSFAETVKTGYIFEDFEMQPAFVGEHCSVWWLPYSDELLQKLSDRIQADFDCRVSASDTSSCAPVGY